MQEIVYHTNYQLEDTYWWFIARNKIIEKIILKKCKFNQKDTLLDVGCGTGGFAAYISKHFNVVGLDTSDIALDYCRKRGLSNLHNCLLKDFPKDNYNTKIVAMLDVVEHIEDDADVVKQVYDLLPENGYFVAAVPAYQWMWSRHDEIHMHYRRYNKKRFLKLFKDAGFKIEYHSYFNTFLFLPAFLKRMLNKLKKEAENPSPVEEVSPFLNRVFKGIFKSESAFLPPFRFPFGVSFVAVGKKTKNN